MEIHCNIYWLFTRVDFLDILHLPLWGFLTRLEFELSPPGNFDSKALDEGENTAVDGAQ